MIRFVRANPHEYLVTGRGGRTVNRGVGGSAFLGPGSTYVFIPATQQEATFEMTQETKDSIPLRFKGIVIYRVSDPRAAAWRFDFAGGTGHDQIKALIGHVCLGELRAVVAHMTMAQCIEERKTTLTDAVAAALTRVVGGDGADAGWGITLEVVQVAQVFIVDQELRRQLEAEVRDAIRAKSELSEIRFDEEIRVAQTASERRQQQEELEAERQRIAIAQEKLQLKNRYDREAIEAETPLRLLRLEKETEVLQKELEKLQHEARVKELAVRTELLAEKARQDLRKEILPLEQTPAIATALTGMFRGMNLSVYGQDAQLLGAVAPMVDLFVQILRERAVAAAVESKVTRGADGGTE